MGSQTKWATQQQSLWGQTTNFNHVYICFKQGFVPALLNGLKPLVASVHWEGVEVGLQNPSACFPIKCCVFIPWPCPSADSSQGCEWEQCPMGQSLGAHARRSRTETCRRELAQHNYILTYKKQHPLFWPEAAARAPSSCSCAQRKPLWRKSGHCEKSTLG